jgi:hypothetical protein
MWRIAIVAAAALGASLLAASWMEVRVAPANDLLAAVERVDTAKMRLCVGPARVTLGGEPFMGLAFGGDGCGRGAMELVGVRFLRPPAATPGNALGVLGRF